MIAQAFDEQPDESTKMTPEEAAELIGHKFDVEYVGGPRCGAVEKVRVMNKNDVPDGRIYHINLKLCHSYKLQGNTEDGFKYVYNGVKPYVCKGNRVYEVKD